MEGRHVTRYLRGSCRAGVQDRWTLEDVTWVRTRRVGAERGSRAGAPAEGAEVDARASAGRWR